MVQILLKGHILYVYVIRIKLLVYFHEFPVRESIELIR